MKLIFQTLLIGFTLGIVCSQNRAMTYIVNRAMFNSACWAESLAVDGHDRFLDARTDPICTGIPCKRRTTIRFKPESILGLGEIYIPNNVCQPSPFNHRSMKCLIRLEPVSIMGVVTFDDSPLSKDRFRASVHVKNDSFYLIAVRLMPSRKLLLTEAGIPQIWFDVEEVVAPLQFDEFTKDQIRRSLSKSLTLRMKAFMYFYKIRLENEFRYLREREDRLHGDNNTAMHSQNVGGHNKVGLDQQRRQNMRGNAGDMSGGPPRGNAPSSNFNDARKPLRQQHGGSNSGAERPLLPSGDRPQNGQVPLSNGLNDTPQNGGGQLANGLNPNPYPLREEAYSEAGRPLPVPADSPQSGQDQPNIGLNNAPYPPRKENGDVERRPWLPAGDRPQNGRFPLNNGLNEGPYPSRDENDSAQRRPWRLPGDRPQIGQSSPSNGLGDAPYPPREESNSAEIRPLPLPGDRPQVGQSSPSNGLGDAPYPPRGESNSAEIRPLPLPGDRPQVGQSSQSNGLGVAPYPPREESNLAEIRPSPLPGDLPQIEQRPESNGLEDAPYPPREESNSAERLPSPLPGDRPQNPEDGEGLPSSTAENPPYPSQPSSAPLAVDEMTSPPSPDTENIPGTSRYSWLPGLGNRGTTPGGDRDYTSTIPSADRSPTKSSWFSFNSRNKTSSAEDNGIASTASSDLGSDLQRTTKPPSETLSQRSQQVAGSGRTPSNDVGLSDGIESVPSHAAALYGADSAGGPQAKPSKLSEGNPTEGILIDARHGEDGLTEPPYSRDDLTGGSAVDSPHEDSRPGIEDRRTERSAVQQTTSQSQGIRRGGRRPKRGLGELSKRETVI